MICYKALWLQDQMSTGCLQWQWSSHLLPVLGEIHCMGRQNYLTTLLTNCKWCYLDGFTEHNFSLSFAKRETDLSSPMGHLCVYHKAPKNRHNINKHQESHPNTEFLARHIFKSTWAEFLNCSWSCKVCQIIWSFLKALVLFNIICQIIKQNY